MKVGRTSTLETWRETRGNTDARRLIALHVVDAVGNGIHFSTFALYLNRHSGLDSWTIGLGLGTGAACGLVSNLVVGRVADTAGPKRVLAVLLMSLSLVFCALPLVTGLASLMAFAVVYSVLHFACGGPFVSLIGAAFPMKDRAKGRALIRSFGNTGMAVGAGLSAGLLALVPGGFLAASPYVNALSFGLAAVLVLTLSIGARPEPGARPSGAGLHAVFLPGMPLMLLTTAILGLHSSLLAVGVPLWISITHAVPAWWVALLIGLNTVLVMVFQVPAAEYAGRNYASAVSASRLAGVIGAAGCVVFAVSLWDRWSPLVPIALISGFVLLTVMELYQNGAVFFLSLNLGSDERRAEYASAFNVTQIVESTAGPLLIGAVFVWQSVWSWLTFAVLIMSAVAIYQLVSARLGHLENREEVST